MSKTIRVLRTTFERGQEANDKDVPRLRRELETAKADLLDFADQVIVALGINDAYADETKTRKEFVTKARNNGTTWGYWPELEDVEYVERGATRFIADIRKAAKTVDGASALKTIRHALKEARK